MCPTQLDIFNVVFNIRNIVIKGRMKKNHIYIVFLKIWYIIDSLNIFKKLIIPKQITSNYNQLCSGYYGHLLTRLRLELSGLNAHRFKYNMHNSPICPYCFLAPEDNKHFFLICPTHALPRQHYLNLLSELDLDTTNHTNILKVILYGNVNHNQIPFLLKSTYQFIKFTGRFEKQNQNS